MLKSRSIIMSQSSLLPQKHSNRILIPCFQNLLVEQDGSEVELLTVRGKGNIDDGKQTSLQHGFFFFHFAGVILTMLRVTGKLCFSYYAPLLAYFRSVLERDIADQDTSYIEV